MHVRRSNISFLILSTTASFAFYSFTKNISELWKMPDECFKPEVYLPATSVLIGLSSHLTAWSTRVVWSLSVVFFRSIFIIFVFVTPKNVHTCLPRWQSWLKACLSEAAQLGLAPPLPTTAWPFHLMLADAGGSHVGAKGGITRHSTNFKGGNKSRHTEPNWVVAVMYAKLLWDRMFRACAGEAQPGEHMCQI